MPITVIYSGETSTKIVFGESRQVTPYIGFHGAKSDTKNNNIEFGTGIMVDEPGDADGRPLKYFYGFMSPHKLIRSWRVMKMMERLPLIEKGALKACFEVLRPDLSRTDRNHVLFLGNLLKSNADGALALRTEMLQTTPDAATLNRMLAIVNEQKLTRLDDLTEVENVFTTLGVAPTEAFKEVCARNRDRTVPWVPRTAINPPPAPSGEDARVGIIGRALGNLVKRLGLRT